MADEEGSDLAAQLWEGCDAALASRLAYPEVRAALAADGRDHDLDAGDLAEAERAWERYWAATRPVELSAAVEQHAGSMLDVTMACGAYINASCRERDGCREVQRRVGAHLR